MGSVSTKIIDFPMPAHVPSDLAKNFSFWSEPLPYIFRRLRLEGHHVGYAISDQTVGNILKRHGMRPAPERKTTTTWKEFVRTHMDVLVATDFFTAEVWTTAGLVTYYVLFCIHLASRKVYMAGVTPYPDARWMV